MSDKWKTKVEHVLKCGMSSTTAEEILFTGFVQMKESELEALPPHVQSIINDRHLQCQVPNHPVRRAHAETKLKNPIRFRARITNIPQLT